MVPPPMNEIRVKSRRSDDASQLTGELNDDTDEPKRKNKHQEEAAKSEATQQQQETPKGPPLTKKNRAFLRRPHRRPKSLNPKKAMSESKSGISSLTSWTGSSLLDDSTASMVPTKPQDIFRSKSPKKSRSSTPKAETRKQSRANAATPQRKNAAPTNDATPVRNNRGETATPPPTRAPPSPPPSPKSSIPLPDSYSFSGNESISTMNDSMLGNMTKRAVDNVMDNLLFEEEMEDYSIQGMPVEDEEDSYFLNDDDKKEEASKTQSHESPLVEKEIAAKDTTTESLSLKDEKARQTESKADIALEPPVVEDASEEDSYFDKDMDVSSLALEDAMSTLEKEQGSVPPDHWHFNVKSLRNKIENEGDESQIQASAEPNEEPIGTEATMEEEQQALVTPDSPNTVPSTPCEVASIRSKKHALVVMPSENDFGDELDKRGTSGSQARADGKALPTPEEYDEVSLNSNKSKQLVVAVQSSNRNASWWIGGVHDEETGSRPSRSKKSSKNNATNNPDEEPAFTFRKTFMILFLVIGIGAITGGIAALVTSKRQGNQSEDTGTNNVQSSTPPRITPPPSAPTNTSIPSSPTVAPSVSSAEMTETSQPPASFRLPTDGEASAAPTASPTVIETTPPTIGETAPPTIDHLKLTLYERVELFSPESFPAIDNATTPQGRALEWALQQPTPTLEQYSLATLRYSSNQEWENDDGWLASPDICSWFGIVCSDDKVTEVALSFNNLASTLPDELSVLTDLEVLSISAAAGSAGKRGKLTGSIPSSWGERLVNLVALELYDNHLTGQLPTSIQYLTDLQMMSLNGNDLWGPLPTELGALSKLDILDLSYNEFSGSIPTETGELSNLVNLKLNDNEITGELPSEIGNMKLLTEFDAHKNVLMGSLPRAIYSLSNLSWLDLSKNEMDGILPPSIGLLSNLEGLSLEDNRFQGAVPLQLSMLTQLRVLELNKNVLTGTVPSQLGSLSNLVELKLETNLLNGTIPDEICAIESLEELTFSDDCVACPCCKKCLN